MPGQLNIAPVDFDAARHACKHWHYSQAIPSGKLIKLGVWEDARYIGVVIFGRGANNNLGKPYGLKQTEICELVRVALRGHAAPVSRIVAIALKIVRRTNPGLRMVISYADPEQGHHGGIYQAGGWLYLGRSQAQREVMYKGKVMHKRTANSLFGTIKGMQKSKILWKHKYALAFDAALYATLKAGAKPYPKRAESSETGILGDQPRGGGEIPTSALQ